MEEKFQGCNIISGIESTAKKYLGQIFPPALHKYESDTFTFTVKGREKDGSTDTRGNSKKLPLSKTER